MFTPKNIPQSISERERLDCRVTHFRVSLLLVGKVVSVTLLLTNVGLASFATRQLTTETQTLNR
jgi:hypothetical protein